jgi:hypothetical protein
MLRQLLVGTAISVCNIAIHALVMTTAVHMSTRIAGAKDTVWQSRRSTTVMIAIVSIATVVEVNTLATLPINAPLNRSHSGERRQTGAAGPRLYAMALGQASRLQRFCCPSY